jgi:DNA invertase Pin-like site-specific DNA recombinase
MQDPLPSRTRRFRAQRRSAPLLRCLKTLQEGDTLIVWELDRLGRSLRDLIAMLDELRRAA